MQGYIYKCTYNKNGKIYVGASSNVNNIDTYLGSGSKWVSEVNQETERLYIEKEILEYVDSYEQLSEREIHWIAKLNATNPDIGYNIHKGGTNCSEETKQKLSQIAKQQMADPEHRKKISEGLKRHRALYGMSESHHQKMSANAKKQKNLFGGKRDSRNVSVYCIYNGKQYEFKNKRTAAQWWFNTCPFSEQYAEITYTRKITASIKGLPISYNKKLITNIQWFEGKEKINED